MSIHPQKYWHKKHSYSDVSTRTLGGIRATKLPMVLQNKIRSLDSLDQSHSRVLPKTKETLFSIVGDKSKNPTLFQHSETNQKSLSPSQPLYLNHHRTWIKEYHQGFVHCPGRLSYHIRKIDSVTSNIHMSMLFRTYLKERDTACRTVVVEQAYLEPASATTIAPKVIVNFFNSLEIHWD